MNDETDLKDEMLRIFYKFSFQHKNDHEKVLKLIEESQDEISNILQKLKDNIFMIHNTNFEKLLQNEVYDLLIYNKNK